MTYFLQKLVGNLCDPDAVSAANEELAAIRAMQAKLDRIRQIINWTLITSDHRERQVREIIAVLDGSDQFTRVDKGEP